MSIAGIALDASSRNPIVLLRDTSGRRQVPIWIDHAQAHNILAGIQDPTPGKPLTHDLLVKLLQLGKIKLTKVIIHTLKEDAFEATLKLEESNATNTIENQDSINTESQKFKQFEIDARPSDAIALAVRTKSSIWMLEEVVASASVPVDAEADKKDQDDFHKFVSEISPAELIKHLRERKDKNPDD